MAETTIFCFSGTGNSLWVAKEIAGRLPDAQVIRICRENMPKTGALHSGNIGFVFPVYYFGLPHMVRDFVRQMGIEKDAYVFAVATYGGGMGIAFDLIARDLAEKGIKLSAAIPVLMPGNFQVMYSPAKETEQQVRFRNAKEKAAEIARIVSDRRDVPVESPNLIVRGLGKIMYSRLKPRGRGKDFYAEDTCTGCGTCTRVCPAGNITLVGKKPRWGDQCEFCLACLQWCPVTAVQYANKTKKRGRYHNPEIHAKDLFRQ